MHVHMTLCLGDVSVQHPAHNLVMELPVSSQNAKLQPAFSQSSLWSI